MAEVSIKPVFHYIIVLYNVCIIECICVRFYVTNKRELVSLSIYSLIREVVDVLGSH